MKDLFRKYPLLQQFRREREYIGTDMIGPMTEKTREVQERAFRLIDELGTGTPKEKDASMICAACITEPPSLFYNMPALFMNYGEDVEKAIERLVGTPAGMNYDTMTGMARAAAGIAMFEDISAQLKAGEKIPAKETLDALKKSFGENSDMFVALQAPELMKLFEATRDSTYAALQQKIDENRPRYSPPGQSFDL